MAIGVSVLAIVSGRTFLASVLVAAAAAVVMAVILIVFLGTVLVFSIFAAVAIITIAISVILGGLPVSSVRFLFLRRPI